jgi:hypothetical protein
MLARLYQSLPIRFQGKSRWAGVDTTTAIQIIGYKSPLMWKRYNSVAESDLITAANMLNTYLSNTVITPDDSSEMAANISA